ncbi:MAG: class I SAM-dependent methyltransferase [bacterium]|nr:class I SAM-dependent methyltransferase [bacterium]
MNDSSRNLIDELRSEVGVELLANIAELRAESQIGPGQVAALRKRWSRELVVLALRISEANERLGRKFPSDEDLMFTPELLEQASSHPVAMHRARRLAPLDPVLDLGCGAGGDLTRLAQLGARVAGVEADPLAAALAQSNLNALGLAGEVVLGTFPDIELPEFRTLYVDPARRGGERRPGGAGQGGRYIKPADFSPSPAELCQVLSTCNSWVIKWGPALDLSHKVLAGPGGILSGRTRQDYEIELVSWNGELREAVLWGGEANLGRGRIATLLRGSMTDFKTHSYCGEQAAPKPAITSPRAWLYEPDPALIRGQLIESYANKHGYTLVAPDIAYLSGDAPDPTPFVRSWPILETFPFSITRAQALLDKYGAGHIILKKRGYPQDPESLRSRFTLKGDRHLTLFIYKGVEKRQACLCGNRFCFPETV